MTGTQAEINRLKWELELREKEAETYVKVMRQVRGCLENNALEEISHILAFYGI